MTSYQQMETWNAFDVDENNDISREEYEAMLASPEARAIEEETQLDALEAAVDISSEILAWEVTFDTSTSTLEEKTVQFLVTKILRLRWENVADSSIDGKIWANSKRDISAVLWESFDGEKLSGNNITQLLSIAGDLISEKRLALSQAQEAQEASESEAREIVSTFDVEADRNNSDKVRALQTALNTLGYSLRWANDGVDGVWGGSTESSYNEEVAKIREINITSRAEESAQAADAAGAEAEESAERVAAAQEAVEREQAELDEAEATLDAQLAEIDATNERLVVSEGNLETSNTELASIQAEIASVQENKDRQSSDLAALRESLARWQELTASEQSELEVVRTELQNIENSIAALTARVAEESAQAETEIQERDAAEVTLNNAQETLDAAQIAATEANEAYRRSFWTSIWRRPLRIAAEEAQNAVIQAEELVVTAQANFDRESGEATWIQERVNLLNAQIAREQISLAQTQTEAAAAEAEFVAAQESLAQISEQLENFDMVDFDARLATLQEQLTASIAWVEASTVAISEITTAITALEADIASQREVVESEASDVEEVTSQLSALESADESARVELERIRREAAEAAEQVERNFPELREIEVYIPEQSEINDYSRESISEMNKYEREAVQRDVNAVLAWMGEELISVDGVIGSGTRRAMGRIGVYNPDTQEYNFVKLVRLAQVARNDAQIDTSLDAANEYQDLRLQADDLLSTITNNSTDEQLETISSQLALLTDVPDEDNDGRDDWTEENKTRRLALTQYITDRASRLVDSWAINNIQASKIIEELLAQEKFESAPWREAVSRMVRNTIDDINALTRNETGQEVASNFSANAAINAIMNSSEPMSMGTSLDRGFFRIAGQNYDIDRAEDMYIVTGNWVQRIGMRDTASLELTNVSIVGNTIVALMWNGCEGNVVYIPLDVNVVPRPPRVNTPRQNPPRVVPPTVVPPTTPPENPRDLDEYERCEGNDYVYSLWDGQGTWNPFDDVLINKVILRRNDPDCMDDGWDDDTPDTSTPGTRGGWDEGGGWDDGAQWGAGRG